MMAADGDDPSNAAVAYGVANYLYYNGDRQGADDLLRRLVSGQAGALDLSRLKPTWQIRFAEPHRCHLPQKGRSRYSVAARTPPVGLHRHPGIAPVICLR